MSEPRPYAKSGPDAAVQARLLGLLRPPAMTAEQQARGAARIAAIAAAVPPPEAPPDFRPAGAASTGAGLIALLALCGALAASAVSQSRARAPSSTVSPPLPARITPEPSPPAAPPEATGRPATPEILAMSAHDLPSAAPSARPEAAPSARPAAPDDALARELALMNHARVAIARGSAEEALLDVARHERDHASGQLRSEREVFAVQALVQLGRRAEASQRAKALGDREPSSPYARRAAAALEGR